MEEKIKQLEHEVTLLKERNRKVEADKAWETSKTRSLSIILITYIIASLVMYFIGVQKFWLDSIIPTLGFTLSIQSLPFIKKWWLKSFVK